MMSIHDDAHGYFTVEASGRVTRRDYDALVPRLRQEIERRGKLRLLILMRDFEGITPMALLEDLRVDIRHRDDFERVAIVGAGRFEKLAMKMAAPFFGGDVRFFESEKEADARGWLAEGLPEAAFNPPSPAADAATRAPGARTPEHRSSG